MGRLRNRLKDFQRAGAQLLVVSADGMKYLTRLRKRLRLNFHLLSDDDLKLIEKLEVREGKRRIARPCTFVIDATGRIRWRHIGNSPSDRPSEDAILRAVKSATKPFVKPRPQPTTQRPPTTQ